MTQPANRRIVTEATQPVLMATVDANATSAFRVQQDARQSAAYARRSDLVLRLTDYGLASGNTASQNTTAINAATADAVSIRNTASVRNIIIAAPRGRFDVNRFTLPGAVSLYGEDSDSTILTNKSTDGLVFVVARGSRTKVRGITLDGQRAAQATTGLATLQFSRPNNNTAGSLNIAGGVVLAAAVSAGATSITVNTASPGSEPITAEESLTLVEGAIYERVRIARTYTPGSTTIPLENPTANAFTVAAQVSVASCDVEVSDARLYGNGRDAVTFWHVIHGLAQRCVALDYEDTGYDVPSAGSRHVRLLDNRAETKGRWGAAFDTAETAYGRTADCTSRGNVFRFLSGGSFTNGNTLDGLYIGNADRCKSIDDTFDLTLAGISGANYAGLSTESEVVNPTVLGPATPRTGTAGVRSPSTTPDLTVRVTGGSVTGMARGVDANTSRRALISGLVVKNFTDYGISFLANATYPQFVSVVGCRTDGGVAGLRWGGTGLNAATRGSSVANIFKAWSYAGIANDGWTVTSTGDMA